VTARERTVTLRVNGRAHRLRVEPRLSLLEALRDQLGLTGTKHGCDQGACGACLVVIDGEPHLSCLTLAVRCDGRAVQTVEGLSATSELHPLQQAAIEHGAVQCGYCTPGWLLAAKVLLDAVPRPTPAQVREAISGNICRCTGYQKIERAILAAAEALARRGDGRKECATPTREREDCAS
jgi:carbon-monoxide dehydrogenase small subunit